MGIKAMKASIMLGAAIALVGITQSAAAAQATAMREYAIERQDLGNALRRFNSKLASRTYVDLGFRIAMNPFTIFSNANNMFDRVPAIVGYMYINYAPVGRCFRVA